MQIFFEVLKNGYFVVGQEIDQEIEYLIGYKNKNRTKAIDDFIAIEIKLAKNPKIDIDSVIKTLIKNR